MKKFIRTGKKTLAVFMAALMVMTAWVFVEPLKASAITSETYDIRITWQVSNEGGNSNNHYSGRSNFNTNSDTNNCAGVSLYYKTNNGTGTQYEVWWEIGHSDKNYGKSTGSGATVTQSANYCDDAENTNYYLYATLDGFPTELFIGNDYAAATACGLDLKSLQVKNKITNTWVTLWSGTAHTLSHRAQTYITINKDGGTAKKGSELMQSAEATYSQTTNNWNSSYPKATSVVWDTSPSDFTITGNTTAASHCNDQYGVRLATTPTATYTSSPSTTLTQSDTNSTTKYSTKITAGTDARMPGQGVNSSDVTINHEYTFNGATASGSKKFTITDPQYNVTLDANDGTLLTNSPIDVYYGDEYGVKPDAIRTGYTLIGFYPTPQGPFLNEDTPTGTELTSTTVITSDIKRYAAWRTNQYTATFQYYDEDYNLKTVTQEDYYGRDLNFPTVPGLVDKPDHDNTITFSGSWKKGNIITTDTTMQAEDVTYIADQKFNFEKANFSALNDQIDAANDAIASQAWKDGGYTTASMSAVTNALNTAQSFDQNNTGRTQQATVDTAAASLKAAIEALDFNTYLVQFHDASGNIIKVESVVYGKNATAPADPTKNDDETKHYSFSKWTAYNTDNSVYQETFTNSTAVKADLDVRPVFTGQDHTWGTAVTEPANCQHGSGTTKTCTVCGRVSATYDDTLGSHVKSASYAVDKQPTCTATGTGHYYCTVCGTSLDTVTVPAKGHNYTVNVTKAATCTTTGTRVISCANCSDTTTETIPLVQHVYAQVGETVAATCAHGSYRTMKCNNCTSTYKEYLSDPVAHDWKITVTPGSNGADGTVQFKCSKCNETYTQAIPYNGHNYEKAELTTAPTCVTPGVITVSCTDPGCTATYTASVPATDEHVLTTTITLATCKAEGSIVEKCKNCTYSKTTTIPKAQHNYEKTTPVTANCTTSAYDVMTCSVCGDSYNKFVSNSTGHTYTAAVTPAADGKSANVVVSCSVCNQTILTQNVPYQDIDHDFQSAELTTVPTCSEDGVITITFDDGATQTVTVPKIADAHKLKTTVTPATCQSKGSVVVECTNAGCTYNETTVLAKTQHHFVEDTTKSVAETCAQSGYKYMYCDNAGCTETYKAYNGDATGNHNWNIETTKVSGTETKVTATCTVCGATVETTVPTGHNFTEVEIITKPTCTATGTAKITCTDADCALSYNITIAANANAHNLQTTYTAPTCISEGSVVTRCTNAGCTYAIETTSIPKSAHNYAVDSTVQATCTSSAYRVMKCQTPGCTATYNEYIAGSTAEHNWSITTAPSATAGKVIVNGECTVCHQTFSQEVDEGHSFTDAVVTKQPTCTQTGTATVSCGDAGCGQSYTVTLPTNAKAHTYGAPVVVASTCQTKGSVTYTCEECSDKLTAELPLAAHNYQQGDYHAATCTHGAYYDMNCADCTEAYKDYRDDPLGHDWQITGNTTAADGRKTITLTCSRCSESFTRTVDAGYNFTEVEIITKPTCKTTGTAKITDPTNNYSTTITLPVNADVHNYETTSVTADCQTVGSVVTKCADCGNVLSSVTFDKTPHAYKNKGHVNATCAEGGYDILTCSVCSDTIKSYTDRPTTNHDWNITTTDASAHQGGTVSAACKICGATFNATVPYDGHNYTKYEVTTAPTCQADGVVTISCSDPDCTASYTVTVPKTKSHVYGAAVVQDATCTAEGYIRYTCLDCGYVDEHTLPLVQHVYAVQSTVPANCQHGAYNVMKCTNCDSTYNEYLGNATTAHTWNITSVPSATHGYDVVTGECTDCGATFTKEIKEGHSFSDAKVTKAPTCTVDGEVTVSCTDADCTASYTIAIPATGVHDYETIYTAATCTSDGSIINRCKSCGKEVTVETIPQLTHAYDYVRTEPTCTADGKLVQTCLLCGDVVETTIAKTGHKTVVLPAVAATCNTTGLTAGEQCGVCGEVLVPQQVTEKTTHEFTGEIKTIEATCLKDGAKLTKCIHCDAWDIETLPATDHKYDNADAVTVVAPTCYTKGYTEHKCDNCGYTYRDNYTDELVHNYIVKASDCIEPTCESIGTEVSYCEYCGAQKVVTIPATDHDWGEWTLTYDSTCTGYGIETRVCKNDPTHTQTRTKDPIGHKYNDVTTDATCTEAGTVVSTCERCGDVNITVLPALGHDYKLVESHDQTCENGAYTKEICERCGDVLYTYDDSKPALGHNWDEWVVVREATCGEDGLMMRTCLNNPEHNEVKSIPATGEHKWVSTVVEPTCTESGFTIYACAGCGAAYRADFIPALEHDFNDSVYEEATCTTPGGTRYTCQRENCGYSYLVEDTPALGHDMGQWYFTAHPTEPDAYAKKRDCNRDGCIYYEYELGEDDSVNVYYKVDYLNDWIAKDGDEGHFTAVDGTVLAKEDADAYTSVALGSTYVLKGEAAVYPSKYKPTREKTLSYGFYDFVGWDLDQNGASLDSVTQNITAHAKFQGRDEYYYVIFANENGQQLTRVEYILHGHSAEYDRYFAPPTKPSDIHNNYVFSHWTRDKDGNASPNSYEAIYSDGTFRAIYTAIPKDYKVIYHDWDGTVLGSEIFEYGAPINPPTDLSRPADPTYIYEFNGAWALDTGYEIDTNSMIVPNVSWQEYKPENEDNEDLTDAEKGIVHVYAKYAQKAKLYRVTIAAVDAKGNPVPGATVQVLNPSGYLVTTAVLGENSEVVLTLHYDTFYTIQVTYDGDVSETQITLDERNLGTNWPTVRVQLGSASDIDPDHKDNCTCICHTFLSRIWITFLNLIYRLFGKKIVCCYDMYATHGDLLVYTA